LKEPSQAFGDTFDNRKSTAPAKRSRKRKAVADAAPPAPAQSNSVTGTPLRIPYGNKDVAMKLGARKKLLHR
jgi:DNA topoisomerase-3